MEDGLEARSKWRCPRTANWNTRWVRPSAPRTCAQGPLAEGSYPFQIGHALGGWARGVGHRDQTVPMKRAVNTIRRTRRNTKKANSKQKRRKPQGDKQGKQQKGDGNQPHDKSNGHMQKKNTQHERHDRNTEGERMTDTEKTIRTKGEPCFLIGAAAGQRICARRRKTTNGEVPAGKERHH